MQNTKNCICSLVLTSTGTNGAIIPPTLAHTDVPPIATFRSTVGKSSLAYMYMMLKLAVNANLPIKASASRVVDPSMKKIKQDEIKSKI